MQLNTAILDSRSLLHKTFTGEKLRLFQPEFSAYGKVNGKFMLTGVFRVYQSFFSGKSFMQWAPGYDYIKLLCVIVSYFLYQTLCYHLSYHDIWLFRILYDYCITYT